MGSAPGINSDWISRTLNGVIWLRQPLESISKVLRRVSTPIGASRRRKVGVLKLLQMLIQ